MSSVFPEVIILTQPNPFQLGPSASAVVVPLVAATNNILLGTSSNSLGLSSVQTTDNTPTTIASIQTVSGGIYYFSAHIVVGSTGNNAGALASEVEVKNVAGTLSMSNPFNAWVVVDAAIAGVILSWAISGTQLLLQVNGLVGQTLNWNGYLQYTFGPIIKI
jgi:hypothetical protein